MIMLRLEGLEGKYCDIEGGQDKYRYGESSAGWFPIESMNFGFQTVTEAAADTTATGTQTGGSNAQVQANSKTPPAKGGKGGNGESFTTIQVSKFVDGTTTSLMRFAMQDRKVTKADDQKMRKADFHFIHSVMGEDSVWNTRYVFPYLMITLENVLIKGWSITATGDDRPTESIEIWYDKAAMRYYRTKDGRVWTGGDISGWDQSKNEAWNAPSCPPYFEEPDNY
jgi:type VI protein secretion system component Hcp